MKRTIVGQRLAIKTLKNMQENKKFHHAMLFYGPNSVGKLSTAIYFLKSQRCTKKDKKSMECCEKCRECLSINFFKNDNNSLIITSSDRLPFIQFYQQLLVKEKNAKIKLVISNYLLEEIYHLIYRHNIGLLKRVQETKRSYLEGEKISNSKLEEILQSIYQKISIFQKTQDIKEITSKVLFKELKTIQNCLDRTFLSKELIEKVFNQAQKTEGKKENYYYRKY